MLIYVQLLPFRSCDIPATESSMTTHQANFSGLHIRKWFEFREETLALETGKLADGEPLVKWVIAAAVANPHAGEFTDSFAAVIERSETLGREFGRRFRAALGSTP